MPQPTDIFSRSSTGAICSSVLGTKHFGHWLCDDALTYLLAKSYGIPDLLFSVVHL